MVPLTVHANITRTLGACAVASFLTPKCVTIGLDMLIPFALIVTRASLRLSLYLLLTMALGV